MRYQWIVLALALTAAGACSGTGEQPEPNRAEDTGPPPWAGQTDVDESSVPLAAGNGAVSVQAYRAERGPIAYVLSNTVLEPSRKVTMHAGLDALVESILVEEGDRVSQGLVLARLEDREIRNEHLQAELALEQAELALEQSEVRARLSNLNLERAELLFEERLTSQQEVDQAAMIRESDGLAFEAAQLESQAAGARLERAKIQLEQTEIRSSIDGVLTERLVAVGDRVQPLQPAFTVEDFFPLLAPVFVSEKEWTQVRVGQAARLQVDVFPQQEFRGRVKTMSPTVDASLRTAKVTVEVGEGQDVLRPGLLGTLYIDVQSHSRKIVVPDRAVTGRSGKMSVFIIRDDENVEERVVTLGENREEWVEVVEGILEGEVVVIDSEKALIEGDSISVRGWEKVP